MDFMAAPPFGEIGRRAARTCDVDLLRPKLIEQEAAVEAEDE